MTKPEQLTSVRVAREPQTTQHTGLHRMKKTVTEHYKQA